MSPIPKQDVVIRFSGPVKLSVLLITAAALLAFMPLTLEAVPEDALGAVVVFLAIPVLFAYLSIVVFTYRIQIASDRISTEAFPSPFLRSEQCLLAEISAVEKDKWWSTLSIFQYQKSAPFRITPLELREAGPIEILDAIQTRIGRDIFLERITDSLRRIWKWHRLCINSIFLLGSAWLSLQLLAIGAGPEIPEAVRGMVLGVLLTAAFLIAVADWFLYRSLNRE